MVNSVAIKSTTIVYLYCDHTFIRNPPSAQHFWLWISLIPRLRLALNFQAQCNQQYHQGSNVSNWIWWASTGCTDKEIKRRTMDAFSKVHMTLHCLQWYMITGQINQCQHSHTACSHSKTGTVETLHACFLLKWSKVDGVEVEEHKRLQMNCWVPLSLVLSQELRKCAGDWAQGLGGNIHWTEWWRWGAGGVEGEARERGGGRGVVTLSP